jgi:hypothetical protein
VLYLLISISLDPLQKRIKCQTLFLSEGMSLLLHNRLDLGLFPRALPLLKRVRLALYQVRLLILLDLRQRCLLLPKLEQFLTVLDPLLSLLSCFLLEFLKGKKLLFFQFLQGDIGGVFIVGHVIIPRI